MKPTKYRIHPIFAAAISVIACASAQAAVLTSFSTFTESPTLLPGTNTRSQAFTTTTGSGTNSVIATAGANPAGGSNTSAGQEVFLSDSFSLATVGARISASLGSLGGTFNNSQAIGLAVATTEAPTSRTNMLTFFYRGQADQRLGYFFDDSFGTITAVSSTTADAINFPLLGVSANPDSIFIERTSASTYSLGSITGITTTIHKVLNIGTGVSEVTANGTAVGVYSDVRASNNVNTLTNFAHVIPEPSAALLGGLGALLLLRRRR